MRSIHANIDVNISFPSPPHNKRHVARQHELSITTPLHLITTSPITPSTQRGCESCLLAVFLHINTPPRTCIMAHHSLPPRSAAFSPVRHPAPKFFHLPSTPSPQQLRPILRHSDSTRSSTPEALVLSDSQPLSPALADVDPNESDSLGFSQISLSSVYSQAPHSPNIDADQPSQLSSLPSSSSSSASSDRSDASSNASSHSGTSSASSSSSSPSASAKKAASRWRWDDISDLLLVKIVHAEEPWEAMYGKLLDTWRRITELFLEGLEQDVFPIPTDRTCRERYEKLAEQRKRLDANPAARSGSNEEHGEIEQLLSECVDAEAKWEQQTKESKEEKLKRKQSNEETQRNLRTNTSRILSQRRHHSNTSSSSASSSAPAASINSSSESEVSGSEQREGHAKRQKPSLAIQKQALEFQKEIGKTLSEQMQKLVASSDKANDESTRSNDLFETFLQRLNPVRPARER